MINFCSTLGIITHPHSNINGGFTMTRMCNYIPLSYMDTTTYPRPNPDFCAQSYKLISDSNDEIVVHETDIIMFVYSLLSWSQVVKNLVSYKHDDP